MLPTLEVDGVGAPLNTVVPSVSYHTKVWLPDAVAVNAVAVASLQYAIVLVATGATGNAFIVTVTGAGVPPML